MQILQLSKPEDFKKHILFNFRESDPFADFEKMFPDQVEQYADELSWLYSTLSGVINHDKEHIPDPQYHSSLIAWNCCNTITAAIEVFGRGHVMESITLLRYVVESLCVVFHISEQPKVYDAVKANTHQYHRSIKATKKVITPVGALWGMFSDRFNHFNIMSTVPAPTMDESGHASGLIIGGGFEIKRKADYAVLMGLIDFVLMIARDIVEISFHDYVKDFKFWRKEGNAIRSHWSQAAIDKKDSLIKKIIKNLGELKINRQARSG